MLFASVFFVNNNFTWRDIYVQEKSRRVIFQSLSQLLKAFERVNIRRKKNTSITLFSTFFSYSRIHRLLEINVNRRIVVSRLTETPGFAKQSQFEFSVEWNSDEYSTRSTRRMAISNSALPISLLGLNGNLMAGLVDYPC